MRLSTLHYCAAALKRNIEAKRASGDVRDQEDISSLELALSDVENEIRFTKVGK